MDQILNHRQKKNVYDTSLTLCKNLLGIYFDKYEEISNAKIKTLEHKYEAANLISNTYDYMGWLTEKESGDSTCKSHEKEE